VENHILKPSHCLEQPVVAHEYPYLYCDRENKKIKNHETKKEKKCVMTPPHRVFLARYPCKDDFIRKL
jgi:hypothetical protein